jgi:steroid 5-alpha reductase family enzyme
VPADAAATGKHYVIAGLFLAWLAIETIADEQQWIFQESKYGKASKQKYLKDDYKRGFCTHGLFSVSRKPANTAEFSQWLVIYLLSVVQGWGLFNLSGLGAVLLIQLMYEAAKFTESITSSKYPEYAAYKKMTPMFGYSRFGARYASSAEESK